MEHTQFLSKRHNSKFNPAQSPVFLSDAWLSPSDPKVSFLNLTAYELKRKSVCQITHINASARSEIK